MSPGDTDMESPENGNGGSGSRRLPCPMHACKRVYTEMKALESHVKDHESPAQSLPGKKLLCSVSGCSASFPSMQKLLEHGRHHYKANIYFQCESCRTKLRSYRGLLAHLHTCSKMPRAKAKTVDPAAPPAPRTAYLPPPQLESVSSPQAAAQQTPPDGSAPASSPAPDSADPPVLGPPILTLQEPPLKPCEACSQPAAMEEASSQPGVADDVSKPPVCVRPAAAEPPDVQSHGRPHGAAYAPSAAVWRKNQAVSSHRRVLWEHTRGRYTCTQCGHTLTNRKEMTQHISSQHGKSAQDAGGSLPKP